MAITYEELSPVIPNTAMRKMLLNGNPRTIQIQALDGYVLHDTNYDTHRDEVTIDHDTGFETVVQIPMIGYHTGVVSCAASYDFAPAEMLDEEGDKVTAYGSRQFFTKLATDVPADQIFGVVEPPHEAMQPI